MYDLDVSPDGTLLSASVGDVSGKQSLRVLRAESLLKGDATPIAAFDFGAAIPSNFVFAPDGKALYGSSYYTGVSNIFRYDLATGKLEAISNTETGFFRPIPVGGDQLVVFRYTGEGFVPARIDATPLADVSPITFLGERDRRDAPGRQGLEARLAGERAPRLGSITGRGPYRSVGRHPARVPVPGRAGLQGLRRGSACAQLLRPR